MNVSQTLNYDIGIYFENLNFGCSGNYYYEYDSWFRTNIDRAFKPSYVIDNKLKKGVCFKEPKNEHDMELACKTVSNFYCIEGFNLT